MERLVRRVLCKHEDYMLAVRIQEQILQTARDDERMRSLEVLKKKLAVVDSWLTLLNDAERFVVQRHLIDQLGWPQVTEDFNNRWSGQRHKAERTLKKYQEKALKRIVVFSNQHHDLINQLFTKEIEEL